MAITRDSRHKRRNTGGRRNVHKKKRKFETGRQPSMTKLVINQPGRALRVRPVRTRGGSYKYRALRLDSGNFSWGSEVCTRKTRILDVVYNASNNELVRTKTLVKSAIVSIDATPFRQWYKTHYGVALGKKTTTDGEEVAQSRSVRSKLAARQKDRQIDPKVAEQFSTGRLLACISSRPGQSGRADGYVLEGRELEFYQRQLNKKKGKSKQ